MAYDPDLAHRREYEKVRADHPEIPDWGDLSDEQKASVRAANEELWRDMEALGRAIATGGPHRTRG